MSGAWQEHCTNELRRCIALGRRGEAAWAERRWQLFEQAQAEQGPTGRILIADLFARGDDLRRYSFFSCYLIRCDFREANLKSADFDLAIVRACDFSAARLTFSTFVGADIADKADIPGKNQFLKVVTNGQIDFALERCELPSLIDSELARRARRAWARQDDLRHEGNPAVRFTRRLLGYGLEIRSIAVVSACLVMGFALIFLASSDIEDGKPFVVRGSAAVLTSVRYFVGLTDVFDGQNGLWAAIGLTETLTGLLMLAILVAAFAKRFTIQE